MLFSLFLTFFKIGLFTFGGGYAMIAVIENICVERKQWITHEDLMNVTVTLRLVVFTCRAKNVLHAAKLQKITARNIIFLIFAGY